MTTIFDYIYRLDTSDPSAPSGGESSETHIPDGWSRTKPSPTATQNVYRAQRTRTYTNGSFTSATVWGSVTKVVDKGSYTNTDYVYRLYTHTPPIPKGGESSETHIPSGWSRTEPSLTAPLNVYRAQRTRTYTNGSFTSATAWGSVTMIVAKGSDTDYVYRLDTSTPPTPTGETEIKEDEPDGWSRTEPSPTAPLNVYRAARTRTYTNGNFTSATAWSFVTKRYWPTILPQRLLVDGLREHLAEGSIRTEMDEGPAKIRKLPTADYDKISGNLHFKQDIGAGAIARWRTLRAFYKDTTAGGSLPFNWTDQLDGTTLVNYRFAGPPYLAPLEADPSTLRIHIDLEIVS